jgi:hypothetical protein
MAQLRCICNERLSNSLFPNCLEGEIKGTYEYKDRSVWECPHCGRLAIDVKDDEDLTIIKWYVPEDGKVGNLFDIGTGEQLIKHLKNLWAFHKEEFKKIEEGFFDV